MRFPFKEYLATTSGNTPLHMISIFPSVQRFLKEGRLPHLLFYGPPGTGKTSTILAIAKQIYSPKEFNSMVLEVCNCRFI